MTSFNKWLKMKTKVTRDKDSSNNLEPKEQEDKATRKEKKKLQGGWKQVQRNF